MILLLTAQYKYPYLLTYLYEQPDEVQRFMWLHLTMLIRLILQQSMTAPAVCQTLQ